MTSMKMVLTLFAALAALVLVGPASAQDAPAAGDAAPAPEPAAPAAEPAAPAAEPAAVETPDEAAAPVASGDVDDATATKAEQMLERDLALFWGNQRDIRVVQKRLFEKDGRFELMPYGAIIPNDDFIVYFPVGMRAGYHFSEAFSVEASFAYAIDNPTDLTNFLEGEGIDLKQADIQEFIKMYYNVNILWAPIYGKISLLGLKLTHFETYIGTGFGIFHTKEVPADDPNGNAQVKPSGNTVLGFRWFLTDHLNIRTEYRQYFFQKFQGGVSIPVELSLGLGVTI